MSPRLRPVHYVSFSVPGGASYFAAPSRKPNARDILAQDDPDLVSKEFTDKITDYEKQPDELRRRAGPVFANRINTRRAIRELILPELKAIQATLADIQSRLARVESVIGQQVDK
jgi:hypothetical protein